jgi:gliding motility-associated-like protein
MPIVNTIVSSSYNGFGVSCYGVNDGSISISSSNGLPPYTYSWSDEMGSIVGNDTINNLQAGFYYVETSDANACTSLDTVQLTSPDSILISLSSQEYYPGVNISCNNGANGTIESMITGGIEDYSYSWIGPDGFVSNESDPVQLGAGWYTLSLSDQNNCVTIDSIQLLEPDSALTVEYSYSVQNSGSNISCFGGSDGSVSIHISGGIPNYQIYWLGPNGFSSNDTLIENLEAGIYFLSIVDSASCTYSEQIILSQPTDSLSASASLQNNNCFGDSSAFILVEASGGSPAYAIDWQGPNGFTSTNFLIEDLLNGSYSYMLSDTNGCMLMDTLQVTSDAEIEANETQQNNTCIASSDGSISLAPTGGGSSYSYIWSGPNGFSSSLENINGLDTGLYCVEIVSDLLCSASFCYTISDPEAIQVITFSPVYDNGFNISTYGNNDGSISITSITGGTPIFDISWNGPDGFSSNSTFINNLISGDYILEITDLNNCLFIDTVYLSQPESLILPTGFTPNRDGYNDLYVVPGINSLNPASIKIYNRWGDLVFESANYANDWDGTGKNGGNLPEGTYFVIVEFEKDNKTLNGYIDLRR